MHGTGVAVERWATRLADAGIRFEADVASRWNGLQTSNGELRLTDGRTAAQVAAEEGVRELALFDIAVAANGGEAGTPLAFSASASTSAAWRDEAAQWLRIAGWAPQAIGDAPGLVVARTIAMLVNEACDAVQQGVCTPEGADQAMKLGLNYPAGPFEWLAGWDAITIVALLDRLDAQFRGERYRASPELRQRAWAAQLAQP